MDRSSKNYREKILLSAQEIALKQGITNIDIRSVAKNCGIASGTVYNYFPSKGDLLVAVIESFWEDAFSNIECKHFTHSSFYINLERMYSILNEYLKKFKENWLEELSFLKTHEKQLGKQKQSEYFKIITNRIMAMMDMDDDLRTYPWSEGISKEKMAEFIFDNMFIKLRKGEPDISFFIIVIKKILAY
ncbi:TetR-family transcriptional regulator [Gottschalkia acidurici 9a]|uniref:TetR-family transcriptional regulator n=1 Tax=Gottschalkia acidurici (strain ATCC 7906 / DSM 604 / BCRC 14475 / CIP 104303 / KCTC 5404 / NCIMB 10678 / 9a) TaxID=1128398 RepID=K0AVJ7_GOTA9|nr:TetR/AcrR family transcriptional regulator [Gottschalkia acidurici]AFS77868.1 TetR-family transcriptional regulator [Gottschalkia acidurici 9a]